MRLRFFTIPIHGSQAGEDELNRFLGSHRILSVDRRLVTEDHSACWAFCVTYLDAGGGQNPPMSKGKVDYREVLPPAEFEVFARLRRLRKERAEQDGVPAYALFTNEQLAAMVQRRVRTAQELGELSGVGPARVEKYGTQFLEVLREAIPRLERQGGKGRGKNKSSRLLPRDRSEGGKGRPGSPRTKPEAMDGLSMA